MAKNLKGGPLLILSVSASVLFSIYAKYECIAHPGPSASGARVINALQSTMYNFLQAPSRISQT